MATYVNDLRLKEIGTGESSGTWGTETNTNLELIGEALSYGTEGITTNADTHTSTVADGSTDPARSMYIKYTGTLDSACTITIAPNTLSRLHFIENGTSGSQNIIISQGSGANVTIPAGDVKVVYLDGAGSGAAVVDAFASLNVVDLKVEDDLTVTDDLIVNGDIDLEGSIDVNGTANLDVVDIDGAVDMASTLQVDGAITSSSGATITTSDNTNQLTLISTDADANTGPNLDLYRNSSSPDASDVLGTIFFHGEDGAGNKEEYVRIQTVVDAKGSGAEVGVFQVFTNNAGTLTNNRFEIDGSEVTVNESSGNFDFRVETNGQTHAFFVDGAINNIGVGYSAAHTATLQGISILSGGQGGGVQINREDGSTPSSGESLGSYAFKGTDSANTNAAADAMIAAEASQNHSGSAAGAELQFYTKPDDTGPGSAPSRRMTIRNDGGVAIGLDNDGFSSQILAVNAAGADNVFYGVSTDANCFASFRDNGSTANIEFGAISNRHVFRADTTVRGSFSADGLLFNTDTAAANALDDYEVGTWTPTIYSSGGSTPNYTASAAVGDYVKIGDIVHANFLIIVTGVTDNGGSGNKGVDGLPFDQNQNSYQQVGIIGYNDVWGDAVTRGYMTGGNFQIMPTGVTQSNYTGVITTGYFAGQISYTTNS